jgi:4-hydroxy-2-oxoheptanedioate aldolase
MHCACAGFAAGAIKRGFDLVMITSDLGSMIAGVKLQITTFNEALKSGS